MSREERLLDENDELRQRVAELAGLTLNHFEFPESWHMTRAYTRLLSALMRVEFLRHEQMDSSGTMHIVQLRKRLKPLGIRIENIFGIGYRISPADKVKLRRYATVKDAP